MSDSKHPLGIVPEYSIFVVPEYLNRVAPGAFFPSTGNEYNPTPMHHPCGRVSSQAGGSSVRDVSVRDDFPDVAVLAFEVEAAALVLVVDLAVRPRAGAATKRNALGLHPFED